MDAAGAAAHNGRVRTLPSRPRLSEEDRAAWAAFAARVAVLSGHAPPPPPTPEAPREPAAPQQAAAPPPVTPLPSRRSHLVAHLAVGDNPGGLDRASWHRLVQGKLRPERRLDLHGRTAQSAYHALHAFLGVAQADGVRCVEVITGRGSGPEGGVLRREFPEWINLPPLRRLVLAAVYPHAANRGAVRLLLRRPR